MGPRLVGRGKRLERVRPHSLAWQLQWGRVLWDAERCLFRLRVVFLDIVASMGPRLVGRGKNHVENLLFGAGVASMGPRLVGRGKLFGDILRLDQIRRLQWGRVLWDAESFGRSMG